MTALSNAEVAAVARAAGLPEEHVPMAVATAWLESRNDPDAVGDKDRPAPGCCSVGLWQINSCPKRDAKDGTIRFGSEPMRLKDPATNGKSMVAISKGGTDWSAWSTHAGAAVLAKTIDIGATGAPVAGKGGQGMAAAGTPYTESDKWSQTGLTDGGTWLRIAAFVAGLGLIILAVVIIVGDQAAGVVNSVGSLVGGKGGGAAKAVKSAATATMPA